MNTIKRFTQISTVIALSLTLQACNTPGEAPTVSGTVTAPGGELAFNPPSKLQRFASSIFGKPAVAALANVSAVGSGVTVELIEVDADGNQVGDAIKSTTTDSSGSYSFKTMTDPDSKYVIRATGSADTMDVRFTSTSSSIDPVTSAASSLITDTASDLSALSVEEVVELQSAVETLAQAVDPTGLSTSSLVDAIKTEASDDEEFANQLGSTIAAGSICGVVKDTNGKGIKNIQILVRDFGDWVTRAKSRTDANGDYCVSVPDGDYILGAINNTSTSTAASEWWSTSGTKYSQIDAEKITVSSSKSVTKNFSLEAGARLTGTVKAAAGGSLATGTPLEGIKVVVRNFVNFFPIGGKTTNANGEYVINVIPGSYLVGARNRTRQAYASTYYDGSTGGNTFFDASKVTLTAGTTTTINFDLVKGYKLSGTILDDVGGDPVTGMRVRLNRSGPAQRLRTNKKGKYRIWVTPGSYTVETYGQSTTADLSAGNQTYSPTGPVTKVSTTVKYNGSGVSQAKVWMVKSADVTTTVSQELSNSDGSVTLYCKTSECVNSKIFVRIDEARAWGSTVYNGARDYSTAGTVIDPTTASIDSIDLLAGGVLSATITSDGSAAKKNFRVRIMKDGSGGDYLIRTHRTHSDGTLILSLPAGTYRVRMRDDGNNDCSITITAGSTTSLSYRTDTNACS